MRRRSVRASGSIVGSRGGTLARKCSRVFRPVDLMMRPIILKVSLFRDHGEDPAEHARSCESMLYLLNWLVRHDRGWLKQYPNTPKLYESGVTYDYKDEIDAPVWQDISYSLATKKADCKDFAAWRCAELLEAGIDCKPRIQWQEIDGVYRFHALVEYPDGTTEDPSRLLGMGGDTPFIQPPEEDDSMNVMKTAECVVKGLVMGDDETKERAQASFEKLCKLAEGDPTCAQACALIRRSLGNVRASLKNMPEDVDEATLEGIVNQAIRPRSRSLFEAARGLNAQEEGLIDTGGAALLSLVPIFGPALAATTPAVVKEADALVTKAQGGDKKAMGKIADTAAKAKQGDAQAQQDLKTLQAVKAAKDATQAALYRQWKETSWNPLKLYKLAVEPTVH
jgi:hypothetical protein